MALLMWIPAASALAFAGMLLMLLPKSRPLHAFADAPVAAAAAPTRAAAAVAAPDAAAAAADVIAAMVIGPRNYVRLLYRLQFVFEILYITRESVIWHLMRQPMISRHYRRREKCTEEGRQWQASSDEENWREGLGGKDWAGKNWAGRIGGKDWREGLGGKNWREGLTE